MKFWVPLGLLGGIGLGRGPFLCATSTLLNTFQKLDRAKHQHESYLCLDYDSLILFARCSSAVNALADHETRFLRNRTHAEIHVSTIVLASDHKLGQMRKMQPQLWPLGFKVFCFIGI